jgi:hypothetical protein
MGAAAAVVTTSHDETFAAEWPGQLICYSVKLQPPNEQVNILHITL